MSIDNMPPSPFNMHKVRSLFIRFFNEERAERPVKNFLKFLTFQIVALVAKLPPPARTSVYFFNLLVLCTSRFERQLTLRVESMYYVSGFLDYNVVIIKVLYALCSSVSPRRFKKTKIVGIE